MGNGRITGKCGGNPGGNGEIRVNSLLNPAKKLDQLIPIILTL
jgi:hypothetical protein